MIRLKIILGAIVMFLSLNSCSSDDERDEDNQLRSDLYFGVNMSGVEFAAVYPGIDGTHYGYPSRDDLAYVKKKGFGLIRFPFRWERIQPELGKELNSVELDKMKSFVGLAESMGIQVLLDMHNFGRYCIYSNGQNSNDNQYAIIGSVNCTVNHFCDVWKRLAVEFKGYTNIWGYDIMNEPYSMLSTTPWFNIAQACITAIREIDMQTPIVVCGDEYASASRWVRYSDNLKNLVDPYNNLIYQAHTYFDADASGNYNLSYAEDGATLDIGITRLTPFVDWIKQNGKRGFVGEYGVPDNDGRWLDVLDRALKFLSDNGINGTYWSAGPRWGDYPLSVQPTNNYTVDRPQMKILEKYLKTSN